MNVKDVLDRFADWREKNRPSIVTATVAARETTVRRRLRLKKKDPLVYRRLKIRCIGSKRWRDEQGPWSERA
jgi:hypothetical protein